MEETEYRALVPVDSFNAETRLCLHPQTHRLYVVKTAPAGCRAVYEALRKIRTPRLSEILYIAPSGENIEVVRPYDSGQSVAELLERQDRLPADMALGIAADVCEGLEALHKRGLVHRDITPNNILVSPDGRARIVDFGITRSFLADKSADTVILGTPGYAAPEQFGFSQSDARTDIYAVGVLLNVMLTGELPNVRLAPGISGKVVGKCTEVDARKRYTDIKELKAVLDRLTGGDTRLDRAAARTPGLRSRNVFVVILSVILYLFLALFSAAMLSAGFRNGALWLTVTAWLFAVPVPFVCFTDFCGIWDRLPFSKGAKRRNQRIVYTMLGILSIFVSLFCIALLPS